MRRRSRGKDFLQALTVSLRRDNGSDGTVSQQRQSNAALPPFAGFCAEFMIFAHFAVSRSLNNLGCA